MTVLPPDRYITTSIPYVNGVPHLGHALELVQADVLARAARQAGHAVRFQSGTDDNALKNVVAAEAAGVTPREYVDALTPRFLDLAGALGLSLDSFVRTSVDPRHRRACETIWRACRARGDLYRRSYTGLYCPGCEAFYAEADLVAGRCPEHGVVPTVVREENWFFRLSRYSARLEELIATDRIRITPATRKNEVLGLVRGGLTDFSVSRDAVRSRGWGIPVPGDAGQTIYVWFDALVNYLTGLGYPDRSDRVARWWTGASVEHVIGKGILRFHAVYWPAILLSAGLPAPDRIDVHEYLTVAGAKISKSAGAAVDPLTLAAAYGVDALRWWLVREVARTGDTDFTEARLVARANEDLANTIGNLVSRTARLARRYDVPPVTEGGPAPAAAPLRAARSGAPATIARALDDFDFRRACAGVLEVAGAANRYADATRPWELASAGRIPEAIAVIAELVDACRDLGRLLLPFTPALAARIPAVLDGAAGPTYPRITAAG